MLCAVLLARGSNWCVLQVEGWSYGGRTLMCCFTTVVRCHILILTWQYYVLLFVGVWITFVRGIARRNIVIEDGITLWGRHKFACFQFAMCTGGLGLCVGRLLTVYSTTGCSCLVLPSRPAHCAVIECYAVLDIEFAMHTCLCVVCVCA